MAYKPFKMKGSPMKRNFGIDPKDTPKTWSEVNRPESPAKDMRVRQGGTTSRKTGETKPWEELDAKHNADYGQPTHHDYEAGHDWAYEERKRRTTEKYKNVGTEKQEFFDKKKKDRTEEAETMAEKKGSPVKHKFPSAPPSNRGSFHSGHKTHAMPGGKTSNYHRHSPDGKIHVTDEAKHKKMLRKKEATSVDAKADEMYYEAQWAKNRGDIPTQKKGSPAKDKSTAGNIHDHPHKDQKYYRPTKPIVDPSIRKQADEQNRRLDESGVHFGPDHPKRWKPEGGLYVETPKDTAAYRAANPGIDFKWKEHDKQELRKKGGDKSPAKKNTYTVKTKDGTVKTVTKKEYMKTTGKKPGGRM